MDLFRLLNLLKFPVAKYVHGEYREGNSYVGMVIIQDEEFLPCRRLATSS